MDHTALLAVNTDHFLKSVGYPAIFVLALVEACCIPFPSEITFGYTGYLASQGDFNVVVIIIVGVVGEICGSLVAYFIGRTGGRALVDRYGKYLLLSHADLDKADLFMKKRGDPAVLFGRITPLLRAFISLVAGIGEMPAAMFAVFTSIGTAIYCTALTLTGYELGPSWHHIVKGFTYASLIVAVLVVVVVALAVVHRIQKMRADRPSGPQV